MQSYFVSYSLCAIAFVSSFPFLFLFFFVVVVCFFFFGLVGWLLLLFFLVLIVFSQSLTGTFFKPFNEIN